MSTGSIGHSVRSALRSCQTWNGPIASTSKLLVVTSPCSSKSSSRAFSTTLRTTRPTAFRRTNNDGIHLSPNESGVLRCNCVHANTGMNAGVLAQRHYSSRPTPRSPPAGSNVAPPRRKRTIIDLDKLKAQGIPITMLTAHDYPSARFIESASSSSPPPLSSTGADSHPSPISTSRRGIDICLVGDSLAMVACGYNDTSQLTLDEMLYHCRSVARGCHTSLLVADMTFGTYHASVEQGCLNAVRLIQEGRMDAVKIEGGLEIAELVQRLSSRGISVMGHVGLTPQRQASLSGYRVQGKTVASALKVYRDALAIQAAGAFAIVLEAVPSRLAAFISQRLDIPTIGIGGGKDCDGQVLVQLDMLGVSSLAKGPRFLKKFAEWEPEATQAIRDYVEEVRTRSYPVEEKHGYPMPDEEWQGFLEAVGEVKK